MPSIFLKKPVEQDVHSMPQVGSRVASHITCLDSSSSDTVLFVFLRHTGCPFAERDVREARAWKRLNPEVQVVLLTHGDIRVRDHWLREIGGAEELLLVHDTERQLYGEWGLGYSAARHFMGARSLLGVIRLWLHGIRNRQASGTRWQRSGMFLVRDGVLVWRHIPDSAEACCFPKKGTLK